MTPLLDSYAGVPGYAILYALLAIALGLFSRRMYILFSYLRLGQKDNRFDNIPRRLFTALRTVLAQICTLKSVSPKDLAGIGHAMMFWGFLTFTISYLFIFIGAAWTEDFTRIIFGGLGAQVFYLILEIFGLLVIIAIVWAAFRRYVLRPKRLEPSLKAGIVLIIVFLLIGTFFVTDGLMVAGTGEGSAAWLPIGVGIANLIADSGETNIILMENLHTGFWWAHMVLLLGFLVYIPYSKHLHLLISPINLFFKSLRPRGALIPIDIETAETLGAGKIEEFTWKQLLDGYACAQCGRCDINCPAYMSGKPLSPKKIILNLKEHLLEEGKLLKARTGNGQAETKTPDRHMIGDVITEDEIWACTTCGSCVEQCPVGNEHLDKIMDMRRNLVLAQSKMPETAQLMLRNMQSRGHPWAGVQSMRLRGDWTEGLDLKILAKDANVDTLFWVGCTGALVERNVEATLSLTRVLEAAGVNFGVLGEEEGCCGDPARRAGYEFQFQTMAEQNIEVLKSYGIKEIVTSCPHCYNTFKNEYPQYGGDFKVVHYTRLIADLIKQGKLELTNELSSVLTYHDPCYLGRYNSEYSAARQVLRSMPQAKLHEMERSHSKSFCCGGGGGHMWIEEQSGQKINEIRIEDVLQTKADTVVAACPYCLQMLEEGIERKEVKESLKAMDLVELVEKAMKKSS